MPMNTKASDSQSITIRPTRPSDSSALSHICLLTADTGKSAESQHTIPELPGLFYVCPYVHLPHSIGFVLVRRRSSQSMDSNATGEATEDEVLGYVVFATDTRAFEEAEERDWFPPLRAKYPKLTEDLSASAYNTQLTDADKRYIALLHAPDRAPDATVAFSPAHLHINILPEVQRQGWGRRLLDTAVRYLRDEKSQTGVWLGMDPRNADAARFYERLQFQNIEGAPSSYVGLKFENWPST